MSVRSPIGGDNSNFQLTCSTCNDEKSNKTWYLPPLFNCTGELAKITAVKSRVSANDGQGMSVKM